METRNMQKLSIQETPEHGKLKWTLPKISVISSDVIEAGFHVGGFEGNHDAKSISRAS